MIRIHKSELPKGIVIRKEDDYRSEEVLQILQEDFFDKCYLCEEKYPTSINVEHFRSYKNYKHLKYDWENLFYACVHCNRIKGALYDSMIDCTKTDPEEQVSLTFHSYPENYVEIADLVKNDESEATKELLTKIYNGVGTPISECEAKNLKKRISKELREFIVYVEGYCDEHDPKLKAVYWEKLKGMLGRESNFAGFKRSIVIQDEKLGKRFQELLK